MCNPVYPQADALYRCVIQRYAVSRCVIQAPEGYGLPTDSTRVRLFLLKAKQRDSLDQRKRFPTLGVESDQGLSKTASFGATHHLHYSKAQAGKGKSSVRPCVRACVRPSVRSATLLWPSPAAPARKTDAPRTRHGRASQSLPVGGMPLKTTGVRM
eukprot:gene4640-biopygen7769